MIPDNHTLIPKKYLLATVQPIKNKEKIAVFLFDNHKYLEELAGEECAACYLSFLKYKENVIGGILISKENFNTQLILHECGHATYDFMKTVNPKFKLSSQYKKLQKSDKNEERFCEVLGKLAKSVLELYAEQKY